MRRLIELLALATATATSACVLPGGPASPNGRHASLDLQHGTSTDGELLAVDSTGLWLLRRDTVVHYDAAAINRVRLSRHSFDGKRTIVWMVLTGIGTGALLTVACSRVENTDCGGVLPAFALSYTTAGALFALGNQNSSEWHWSTQEWERLRPYARFPQGLPPGVERAYPMREAP
jgi:hypothetical protein